jgi:hypothetical protein
MLDWMPGVAVIAGLTLAGVAGLGFVQVVGGRSGEGAHTAFAGLFPAQGRRDWPVGVQESDAPRFDVAHLDALRPAPAVTTGPGSPDSDPVVANRPVEIVELDEHGSIALERVDVRGVTRPWVRPGRRGLPSDKLPG